MSPSSGPGTPGLYGAHLLRAADPALRVVVLEAGGRVGGRVLTQEGFAPWPVDLVRSNGEWSELQSATSKTGHQSTGAP